MPAWSIEDFSGRRTWCEKEQRFSSTSGEEALLLDGFLRDIDSRNHAIIPSRLVKNQTSISPLHGALRTTDKQTDSVKGAWNLQYTTYTFGDECVIDHATGQYLTRYSIHAFMAGPFFHVRWWPVLPVCQYCLCASIACVLGNLELNYH